MRAAAWLELASLERDCGAEADKPVLRGFVLIASRLQQQRRQQGIHVASVLDS